MKIIIVRHGDPDYSIDSLTETGWKEARLAAERVSQLDVKEFYVSPLGRAQDTARCTLEKIGRTATTCDWMREFWPHIKRPDLKGEDCPICWDFLPKDWTSEPRYYDVNTWADTEVMREGHVKEAYEEMCQGLDELLAGHGYVREENYYRAVKPNNDTICFFCHFGITCAMISHLLHVSPMILWHGFCAAPSSVTTIITEEREKGIASFRVNGFGDISHLYQAGQEPSFAARFCECYDNTGERHS